MVSAAATLKALGRRAPKAPEAAARAARDLVRSGMPSAVVEKLAANFGVSVEEIQRVIGLSRSTGARRRARREPLRPLASDRAFRMASVFALAQQVFEGDEKASAWFKEPNRALGGERPLALLDTEAGSQQVVTVLKRLEYGVYS